MSAPWSIAKPMPLLTWTSLSKPPVLLEHARVDVARVGRHAGVDCVAASTRAGDPGAVAEDVVAGVRRLGRHEVGFGDHPRIAQAVESGERRMRVVDAAVDDADDDARAVAQQRARDIAVNRRDAVVDRPRRCRSARRARARASAPSSCPLSSLRRPLKRMSFRGRPCCFWQL